jgi:hypothetical protein
MPRSELAIVAWLVIAWLFLLFVAASIKACAS